MPHWCRSGALRSSPLVQALGSGVGGLTRAVQRPGVDHRPDVFVGDSSVDGRPLGSAGPSFSRGCDPCRGLNIDTNVAFRRSVQVAERRQVGGIDRRPPIEDVLRAHEAANRSPTTTRAWVTVPAMSLAEMIGSRPGARSGKPCFVGTRITVDDVLDYLAAGMTAAEIIDDFPVPPLAAVPQLCRAEPGTFTRAWSPERSQSHIRAALELVAMREPTGAE